MGYVFARVDRLLQGLEDVLPANHDDRVDPSGEQRCDCLSNDSVAFVLESVDLDNARAVVLARDERVERLSPGRYLAKSMEEVVRDAVSRVLARLDVLGEVRALWIVREQVSQQDRAALDVGRCVSQQRNELRIRAQA